MYCAQFLVCLIAWFFGFWLCMCISQLALFFAMILRIPSYLFFAKFRWFSVSAFCRIIGVPHPRLQHLLVPYICFFLRHMIALLLFRRPGIYFVVLVHFFAVLLLSSLFVFLLYKSVVIHQFALARFVFFLILFGNCVL